VLQIDNRRTAGSGSLDEAPDNGEDINASICVGDQRRLDIDDKQSGFRY
jgi:hypothetical protein